LYSDLSIDDSLLTLRSSLREEILESLQVGLGVGELLLSCLELGQSIFQFLSLLGDPLVDVGLELLE
jgi:hypothetical protein